MRAYRVFCQFVGLLQLIACCGGALWWVAQNVFAASTPFFSLSIEQTPP